MNRLLCYLSRGGLLDQLGPKVGQSARWAIQWQWVDACLAGRAGRADDKGAVGNNGRRFARAIRLSDDTNVQKRDKQRFRALFDRFYLVERQLKLAADAMGLLRANALNLRYFGAAQ